MFNIPIEHTTTYQHVFEERMNVLVSQFVAEGMDELEASDKARFDAREYAVDFVRRLVESSG